MYHCRGGEMSTKNVKSHTWLLSEQPNVNLLILNLADLADSDPTSTQRLCRSPQRPQNPELP